MERARGPGRGLRGHAGAKAGDPAGAEALLAGGPGRVSVMDQGARESIANFEEGVGDAAITAENAVLVAKQEGKPMDCVVPPSTGIVENPITVVDADAKQNGGEDLAAALVDLCLYPEAQAAFAACGPRPSDPLAVPAGLPPVSDPFTVRDLGGWAQVKNTLFVDGAADDRPLAAATGSGK